MKLFHTFLILTLSLFARGDENGDFHEPKFLDDHRALELGTGTICSPTCGAGDSKYVTYVGPCSQTILDSLCNQSYHKVRHDASVSCSGATVPSPGNVPCICWGGLAYDLCTMTPGSDATGAETCTYTVAREFKGECAPITEPLYCNESECKGESRQVLQSVPAQECYDGSPTVNSVCATAKAGAMMAANDVCDPNITNPNCSCQGKHTVFQCSFNVISKTTCDITAYFRYEGQCTKPPPTDTCPDITCAGGLNTEEKLTDCSDVAIARYCHDAQTVSIDTANRKCEEGSFNPQCLCKGMLTSDICKVMYNPDNTCSVYRAYKYEGKCDDAVIAAPTPAPTKSCDTSKVCSGTSGSVVKKVKGICKKSFLNTFCLRAKLTAKMEADLQCDVENKCECKGKYRVARCYSTPVITSGTSSYCVYVAKYIYEGQCAREFGIISANADSTSISKN